MTHTATPDSDPHRHRLADHPPAAEAGVDDAAASAAADEPGSTPAPGPRPSTAPTALDAHDGGRRSRSSTRRTHRVRAFFDDAEYAAVHAAARRAAMTAGAWVATVAVTRARHAPHDARAEPAEVSSASRSDARSVDPEALLARVVQVRDEVHLAWRHLRTVGGLLNQVAAIGNATGELPPNIAGVLERVGRSTERLAATEAMMRAVAAEYRTLL